MPIYITDDMGFAWYQMGFEEVIFMEPSFLTYYDIILNPLCLHHTDVFLF